MDHHRNELCDSRKNRPRIRGARSGRQSRARKYLPSVPGRYGSAAGGPALHRRCREAWIGLDLAPHESLAGFL